MEIADVCAWEGLPYKSPRDWQAEARPEALKALQSGTPSIIEAVMGAGKSALIGEICHSLSLDPGEIVVITTPTVRLVGDLYEAIQKRVGPTSVGAFYMDKKQIKPFTVCCIPSAPKLSERLQSGPRSCSVMIMDEAHKTECDTMHEAHEGFSPDATLGFTATPFRADDSEALSLFEDLIYEYNAQDAIKDGVVVPPKLVHYDGHATTLDDACIELIEESYQVGPGMANAKTIEGAKEFASKLRDRDIKAESVHSEMPKSNVENTMYRLRESHLDCVVHVNMLSEGEDFPWLRWLCLRREVQSRTRFCQEVGRVLRSCEGKDYAYLLDPHDLFHDFGLTYEAVLRGGAEKREDLQAAEEVESAIEEIESKSEQGLDFELKEGGTPVQAVDAVSQWLRKVKLAMQTTGLVDPEVEDGSWRYDLMTRTQLKALKSAIDIGKKFPEQHQKSLKVAYRTACNGDLTKGEASDFISILYAVGKYGWPEDIDELVD